MLTTLITFPENFKNFTLLTVKSAANESMAFISIIHHCNMSLFGNFTITEQEMSEGGQAKLLTGQDLLTENTIAVKVYQNEKKIPKDAFQKELEVLRVLRGKKNICQAVGAYISPNYSAIAMEMYDCDLFKYAFEEGRALGEPQVRKLFKKICSGVHHMHKAGVAHLDLKPENILINYESEDIAICDFGLSYISTDNNRNSKLRITPCGTEEYLAPEVGILRKYSPFAVDIYSLGCVLFVLLTGCFPSFNITGDLIFPPSVHVSKPCKQFINMLLTEDPDQRPNIQQVLAHPYLYKNLLTSVIHFCKNSRNLIKKVQ